MNLSDCDDRIGAGGITATDLLADIAKQRQATIDRLMDTIRGQTAHDSEGLRDQMVGVGDTVDIRGEQRRIVRITPFEGGAIVAHVDGK